MRVRVCRWHAILLTTHGGIGLLPYGRNFDVFALTLAQRYNII